MYTRERRLCSSVGFETRGAEIETRHNNESPIDFVHSSRPRQGQVKIKAVFTRRQSAYFESWLEMRILNHDSKYGILDRVYAKKHRESWFEMRISNHVSDVFWSYASQITILDVFWRTHGQNTVFWIVIQDAHLESRFKSWFKIRTLPSCENSPRLVLNPTLLCRVCGLAFQSGEMKPSSFMFSSDMLIAILFEIEFLLENARFIGGSHGSG